MAFEVEKMFEEKRRESGSPVDDRFLAFSDSVATAAPTIPGRSEGASTPTSGLTLSQVYERYLQDPTKRRSDRTMLAHHTTRHVVEDVLGGDKPIAAVTREDCRDLLDTLRWLPVNLTKKYGDLRVREAARAAKADASIRTINATNLNAYMARFATMLNWAVAEEYLGRNPARGLQLAETVHPQDRRRPFATWQLRRIFIAPIYTGCRDDAHGYAIPGDLIASGARYWVPLICLFSGMRLPEEAVAYLRMIMDRDFDLKSFTTPSLPWNTPTLISIICRGRVRRRNYDAPEDDTFIGRLTKYGRASRFFR